MADIQGRGSDLEGPYAPASMANALARFPNWMDADFAKRQGFTHARPDAEYLEGKKYTVSPGSNIRDAIEVYNQEGNQKSKLLSEDITGPRAEIMNQMGPGLRDLYMQNALAAKRSALASLGWNPQNDVLNFSPSWIQKGPNSEVAGFHVPNTMQNWVNARNFDRLPEVMLHEALHRGITKLQGTGYWDPAWNEFGSPLPKGFSERNPEGNRGPLNESVVRWLMQTKMGDPEGQGETTGPQAAQKRTAAALFGNQKYEKMLKDMEAAASRYLAAGKPNPLYVPPITRGPR